MLQTMPKPEDFGAQSLPYHIHSEDAFEGADYLPAHDLDMLLSKLVDRHAEILGHLSMSKVHCLWKAKGGMRAGKQVLGKTLTTGGLVAYYSEADFIIWLAADHLREAKASERTIEACLFHRACHIHWDEEAGKSEIVGYDFEGFSAELKIYGIWRMDLVRAKEAFEQMSLPGAE